jgi:hypothetical protein
MNFPGQISALQRLKGFKPVASFHVLRNALEEEFKRANEGKPLPPFADADVEAFAEHHGFAKCEMSDCDMWYNFGNEWFVVHQFEGDLVPKKICRMCAMLNDIETDF